MKTRIYAAPAVKGLMTLLVSGTNLSGQLSLRHNDRYCDITIYFVIIQQCRIELMAMINSHDYV